MAWHSAASRPVCRIPGLFAASPVAHQRDPQLVALARELARPPAGYARGPSLRDVSAELAARGYTTPSGKPYSASAVQSMLQAR
jgi:hypothetical protein